MVWYLSLNKVLRRVCETSWRAKQSEFIITRYTLCFLRSGWHWPTLTPRPVTIPKLLVVLLDTIAPPSTSASSSCSSSPCSLSIFHRSWGKVVHASMEVSDGYSHTCSSWSSSKHTFPCKHEWGEDYFTFTLFNLLLFVVSCEANLFFACFVFILCSVLCLMSSIYWRPNGINYF